jgi:hypothetical protein
MPSRRSSHLARNNLREKPSYNTPRIATPTVSVERPFIWNCAEDEKSYMAACQAAIGKSVKAKHRSKHAIVPPAKLALMQVHKETLAEQNLTLHWSSARFEVANRLAILLQDRLNDMLKHTPQEISLALGKLAVCQLPGSKTVDRIGFQPSGWKGLGGKYAPTNSIGEVNSLHQLAAESALYKDTIYEAYEWFEPKDMVVDPQIAFVESQMGDSHEVRNIGKLLEIDLPVPYIVRLGDPVITLSDGRRDLLQLPARHSFVSPLAA